MELNLSLNTVEFLHWVARQPRRYGETLEAWRSSCPRLTAWEDSLAEGLVRVEKSGAGAATESMVVLTSRGRAALKREE